MYFTNQTGFINEAIFTICGLYLKMNTGMNVVIIACKALNMPSISNKSNTCAKNPWTTIPVVLAIRESEGPNVKGKKTRKNR